MSQTNINNTSPEIGCNSFTVIQAIVNMSDMRSSCSKKNYSSLAEKGMHVYFRGVYVQRNENS